MTQTFKTDSSFFTLIMPPRTPIMFHDIYKWVELDGNARFRFIRDLEVEEDRLTLDEVIQIYPGVKTIGVVTNPWARIAWTYANTVNPKVDWWPSIPEIESKIEGIDFSSFENFVSSIENCESDIIVKAGKIIKSNHRPTKPQSYWLEDSNNAVDFLIRSEYINQDFEPIQEYFCTDQPLEVSNFEFDYRPYYNEQTKKAVQRFSEVDIEKYGYTF